MHDGSGSLLVVVVLVGLMVGIAALFVRAVRASGARHVDARQRTWVAVAGALGLRSDGDGITGVLQGQAVEVSMVTRGSEDSRTTHTVIRGMLTVPLDLGVSLAPEGPWSALRGGDVLTGHFALDARYVVRGDEAPRVVALFRAMPRLTDLLSTGYRDYALDLGDAGVVAEVTGAETDGPRLRLLIETVARATQMLDEARASVPVATALRAHAVAWAHYARLHGLRFCETPLCLWGTLDGRDVWLHAVRQEARGYALEVRVAFPKPLGLGAYVYPATFRDKLGAAIVGGEDWKLGDPRFDEAFVVHAAHPARLRALLQPHLLHRLQAVHDRVGALSLDDRGIAVRTSFLAASPGGSLRLAADLGAVVDAIAAQLRGPEAGPYR